MNIYALFAAVALSFGTGWTVNGWRLGVQVAQTKGVAAEDRAAHAQGTLNSVTAAQTAANVVTTKVSAVDTKQSKIIKGLQDENETLRRSVASGVSGLRIAATCPGPVTTNLPEGSSSSSVDTGISPRLDAGAGQDYFSLREGIQTQRETLIACQGILVELQK